MTEVTFPLRTVVIFDPPSDAAMNDALQIRICDRWMQQYKNEGWEHRIIDLYLLGTPVETICAEAPCAPGTLYKLLKQLGVPKRNTEPKRT